MSRVISIDSREPIHVIDYVTKMKKKYKSLDDVIVNVGILKEADLRYEDEEKIILIERKEFLDAISSIYDNRFYEQIEKIDNFTDEIKDVQKFVIITGNWSEVKVVVDRLKAKGQDVNKYSIYAQVNGFIKDALKKGIIVLVLPDDAVLADFFLKIVEDKEQDYELGSRIITKNKKEVDRFALSLMALINRLGKQNARIISKNYHSYKELQSTNAVDLSNVIRKELGKKESKKPLEKIKEIFDKYI